MVGTIAGVITPNAAITLLLSYESTESGRVDWAVSELGAYASGGELGSLEPMS